MIKFILFLVFLYFAFKFVFALLGINIAKMAAKEAVRDAQANFQQSNYSRTQNNTSPTGQSKVEDIDFEEIK